jgi:hypothetical protein
MKDIHKLIATEKEISRLLAKLEADTDMVVDRLELQDTETTAIGDTRPQLLRRVVIEMKRLPGTRWAQ